MKLNLKIPALLIIVAAILLAGCGGAASPTSAPPTAAPAAATSAPAAATSAPSGGAEDFSFALITPNPRGDRSFIDASARGAEKAIADLKVKGDIIEARTGAEQEPAMRQAMNKGYDLILVLAPFAADSFVKIATETPNQEF